jgi:glycosyltransferase involved in cell wall biosynthesis
MRICLIGEISGTPDEGMKNISETLMRHLKLRNEILSFCPHEIVNPTTIKRLKKFSPKIIHYLHGPTIRSLVMLKILRVLIRNNVKIVVSATRPYFSPYSRWAIPFIRPDLILTQSAKFENLFKENQCKVQFIPNGVDCQKFHPVNKNEKLKLRKTIKSSENIKIILHVGHIKSNRNLEIFKNIQKIKSVQVVIVGSTAQKLDDRLKNELENSGIIVFHEYFNDISAIYKAADLYVFTIHDNGVNLPGGYNQVGAIDLPLSVLEAMACNLPIFTTRFGALPRLFKDDDGFHYFDDESELIQQVNNYAYHKTCKNREKVSPYDWNKIILRIEKEYQNILN